MCADPRVRVEGVLDARWVEPVVRICEDLRTMADVDASARVRIVAAGSDVVVDTTLADGRTALRRVRSPEELRLTVEALVTVPPAPPDPGPPVKAPKAAPPPSVSPPKAERPESAKAPSTDVEIGVALGGRVARAPTYLSVGPAAYAGFRSHGWLLGVTSRWEPLQTLASTTLQNFEMDSIGAGVLVACDLARLDGFRFDTGVTTSFLSESQSIQIAEDEMSGASADVRLGLLARALFGSSPWRWTLALDVDLSPSRLRRSIRIDDALPTLPAWSLGIGAGASWGNP